MKRIAINLVFIFLAIGSLHAIDRKFRVAYEAFPSAINTTVFEFGLSEYIDDQYVFFRPDTIQQRRNFFQRLFSSSSSGNSDKKVRYFERVRAYKTSFNRNGELNPPVPAPELDKIGVAGRFGYDRTNQKIYFSVYNEQRRVHQLFESKLENDNSWSKPVLVNIQNVTGNDRSVNALVNAGWQYNNSGVSITNPTVANDGKRIYFTSNNIRNGMGGSDIWFIDQRTRGWSSPRNVGRRVNSEFNEDHAFVSGDSLLYFSSDRPGGQGGYDIYVSTMVRRQWNRPEPAARIFNSPKDDYGIVGNGLHVAFISNRDSLRNDDDIYLFRLLPAAAEPILPQVPREPIPAPDPVFHYVLFFFDFDRDIFRPEFETQLYEVITEINEFPDARFEIAGHTDERGSDAYNERLSLRRAQNIKQMLVDRGVAEDILEVVGHGRRLPVIPNARTEEDNAQNRRVEINIIQE